MPIFIGYSAYFWEKSWLHHLTRKCTLRNVISTANLNVKYVVWKQMIVIVVIF